MMRLCSIAVLLCVGMASAAMAQDAPRVVPGDATLDVTPVRAGIDSLAVLVVEGEEAFQIATYVIDTVIEGGRIERTDRMSGLAGEMLWGESVVLEDGSLRVIEIRSAGSDDEVFAFAEGAVNRSWVEDGSPRSDRADLPDAVFHAASLDFVLRSLPLEVGYAAEVPIFEPAEMGARWIPISVSREIAVTDLSGRQTPTWEVQVDIGGAVDVYHFDMASGAMVRYESAADSLVMLRL